MRWAGRVARFEEIRNALTVFIGKPEGKRPRGRHRHRWEDNVRMDLRIMGSEVVDRMHLTDDRDQWWAVVNRVMTFRVP